MQAFRHTTSVLTQFAAVSDAYRRCFSSSGARWNKQVRPLMEGRRMAKMIKKLMTAGAKRTTRGAVADELQHPSKHLLQLGFTKAKTSIAGIRNSGSVKIIRRTDMLNNLFVEQITSLLATEEVVPGFLGLGVQISKVKITPDFSAVSVYWYASGTDKDAEIEQLLAKNNGHIRHCLSQLRVLGIVPPINFLKDTTFAKLQEVETLLAKYKMDEASATNNWADGDDSKDDLRPEGKTEGGNAEEKVMPHNILGVKHDLIMARLVFYWVRPIQIQNSLHRQSEKKKARERAQIASREEILEEEPLLSDTTPSSPPDVDSLDPASRQRQFLKYLKQKQHEKTKEVKLLSTAAKETEFYTEEREARKREQLSNFLSEFVDVEDYDDEHESDKYNEDEDAYYRELKASFKEY